MGDLGAVKWRLADSGEDAGTNSTHTVTKIEQTNGETGEDDLRVQVCQWGGRRRHWTHGKV